MSSIYMAEKNPFIYIYFLGVRKVRSENFLHTSSEGTSQFISVGALWQIFCLSIYHCSAFL